MALDTLLKDLNAYRRIPKNKRKALLMSLNYIPHPALVNGRLNQNIVYEGGKPRVFIKRNHMLCLDTLTGVEVYQHYMKSQGYNTMITMPVVNNLLDTPPLLDLSFRSINSFSLI